jgi:membrane associated rhomboid family serine protease
MSNYQSYRPNRFPPVVKNLLIVNALVFVAQMTFGNSNPYFIENLFALHDVHSVYFKPHQLITYMFLHGGFEHILFNMLALWMFGSMLENYWGAKRFLQYYIICGLGAGLLHLGVLYFEMKPAWDYIRQFSPEEQEKAIYGATMVIKDQWAINAPTLGASGAIFGCLAAFGYLFPNSLIYLYFMIPIKAKWFVLIYGALELWLGVRNSPGDSVAHFAHLGGAITGIIIVLIWNKTNRKTLY